MSTRSFIGMAQPDGSIKSIYCHFDGYPTGVGETLCKFYSDPASIQNLLNLGNLSSLKQNLNPPKNSTHSFSSPMENVCVAYGRDRGEANQEASVFLDRQTFQTSGKESWADYVYLFDQNEWLIWPTNSKLDFKPLSQVLEVETFNSL